MKQSWIWPYVQANKRLFVVVVVLGFLTVFSSAALLFTSGFLISKSATRPENILLVYVPIVAVRTFGISRAAFKYVERLMGHRVVLKILSALRVRVYSSVEPAVLSPLYKKKTGDLLGILADDIERLQDIYLKTVFPSLAALALYAVGVIALGFYSWSFAFLMAIYAGVLVGVLPFVTLLVTKAKVMQMKTHRHELYEQLTDAVMGLAEWQFSGRQKEFVSRYEAGEMALFQMDATRARFTRWRNSFAQLMVAIMVMTMLWWASGQASAGSLAPVLIAAFVLVIFPLTEVFLPLSDAVGEVPSYRDSLDRLEELPTSLDTTKFVGEVPLEITLQLEAVHYQYGNKEVLTGVDFTISPGETVAMLGRSGSGKSTIASLVRGDFLPSAGKVTLNGVDAFCIGESMASWVAVLNQQPHVFDTSILNNIRLGRPNASDEEVFEAARRVQLHDYIMSLPNGYQTPLHETGMRFSGGERQRIALARILLQDAPLVILDEPTVGLDPITEAALLETIFDVFREKSVLWITHHLSFIQKADRVVFVENGRISMEGVHEEMLVSNKQYQHLYQMN